MEGNGVKLGLMAFVAFLFLMVGITGKLGSLLGSVIDPGAMQEGSSPTGTSGNFVPFASTSSGLPTTGVLTPAQIGSYAKQAGFNGEALTIAIAVALAESSGNVAATHANTNGSTDYGLWQINSIHSQYSPVRLKEPLYNAQAAYAISAGGRDWTPWVTYTTGAYARFLNEAQLAAQG